MRFRLKQCAKPGIIPQLGLPMETPNGKRKKTNTESKLRLLCKPQSFTIGFMATKGNNMEIPETVWAEARALVHRIGFSESTLFVTNLYEIAATAIIAERDRCAQIAWEYEGKLAEYPDPEAKMFYEGALMMQPASYPNPSETL